MLANFTYKNNEIIMKRHIVFEVNDIGLMLSVILRVLKFSVSCSFGSRYCTISITIFGSEDLEYGDNIMDIILVKIT